ncbi:MAG: 30S ribosomal protein S4 [Candidatus Harrisonbacteria bacterium]|nr:30S ribosomal protein S4 [Candidatus Harrisonbacteria bacterium]
MFDTREKKERSLGTKLFLKAVRCNSPKCATVRRPTRPGLHGKGYKNFSEFGQQLREKQKVRFTYGIREAQMEKIFQKASKNPGVTGEMIISLLERRLDNVIYRLGFAASRSIGRQLVSHGHILINGRKVTIPSYGVKVGDIISIRSQSQNHPVFKDLADKLKKYEAPVWLALDPGKLEGRIISEPKDFEAPFDINQIVDFYAK